MLYGSFAFASVWTFCFSSDDPFVTLRYAANIAHGHGAVFNVGQRVEGFSSPLHLVLAFFVYLLPGGHDLFKMKLLSLVFAVLTLVTTRKLVNSVDLPAWAQTAALFLVGSSWALAVSGSNGLETTLACWLTTLLVLGLVTGQSITRPAFLALCGAGLVAARPEGIAIVFMLALIGIAVETRCLPIWRRSSWLLGPLACFALTEALRLAYYGQVLSNTYFAKRGELGTDIQAGLNYLLYLVPGVPTFLRWEILAIVVVGAIAVTRSSNRRLLYVLGGVVVQLLFVIEVGGDWMLGNRFLTPIIPLAAVIVAKGIVTVIAISSRQLTSGIRWLKVVVYAIVAVGLLATVIIPFEQINDPVWNSRWRFDDASLVSAGGYRALSLQYWPAGLAFLRCIPSGSLVAYSEVGYAGFERLDLRFLDTRGLTDTTIAQNAPGSDKTAVGVTEFDWMSPSSVVGSQILQRRPLVILTFDWPSFPPPNRVLDGTYITRRIEPDFVAPYQIGPLVLLQRTSPPTPTSVVSCERQRHAR